MPWRRSDKLSLLTIAASRLDLLALDLSHHRCCATVQNQLSMLVRTYPTRCLYRVPLPCPFRGQLEQLPVFSDSYESKL